jgi:hypothetical protein
MYNMDISILGYKISLEILILIGVIYLIMAVHTIMGTCNVPLIMEGMAGLSTTANGPQPASDVYTGEEEEDKKVEGFTPANTNYGESSSFSLTNPDAPDTSNWGMPSMVVRPGEPLSKGVQEILNRPKQPIPLPEGQLLMFANTPFKPECCPNTYSNSTGCACMTVDQYDYLRERGGNNVPYSEY